MSRQNHDRVCWSPFKNVQCSCQWARCYEKIRAKDSAIKAYTKYLDIVKDPVEYKLAKEKLEKLEGFGTSDAEESVGLIDKIMGFFNKDK